MNTESLLIVFAFVGKSFATPCGKEKCVAKKNRSEKCEMRVHFFIDDDYNIVMMRIKRDNL